MIRTEKRDPAKALSPVLFCYSTPEIAALPTRLQQHNPQIYDQRILTGAF